MQTTVSEIGFEQFLDAAPVFSLDDLVQWLDERQVKNARMAAYNLTKYYRRTGRLSAVKEGIYFVVPAGQEASSALADPYLVASKFGADAVLAFHSALDLLGFGHSTFNTFHVFSDRPRSPFRFRNDHFRVVQTPEPLLKQSKQYFGTEKVERLGMKIVVTGKERTLVECLERPHYCGGFEEMYRSLEKMPYLQFDVLLEYLAIRAQKNLYARTGFFLSQHAENFHVDQTLLTELRIHVPAQPVYWTPVRKGGAHGTPWNLIVPEAVYHHSWEQG